MSDTTSPPRFRATHERIDATTVKVHVEWKGAPITMNDAFPLLAGDPGFRAGLISALQSAPFNGYFWETPPASKATAGRKFEFVVVDGPAFQRVSPERAAFEEHFSKDADRDGIVTFENLGRDATLIVPCPLADDATYAHLAAFVRNGPPTQVDALFKSVGETAVRLLSERPRWLSTAGMGIYWLHVRSDSRPKYYRHGPYTAV